MSGDSQFIKYLHGRFTTVPHPLLCLINSVHLFQSLFFSNLISHKSDFSSKMDVRLSVKNGHNPPNHGRRREDVRVMSSLVGPTYPYDVNIESIQSCLDIATTSSATIFYLVAMSLWPWTTSTATSLRPNKPILASSFDSHQTASDLLRLPINLLRLPINLLQLPIDLQLQLPFDLLQLTTTSFRPTTTSYRPTTYFLSTYYNFLSTYFNFLSTYYNFLSTYYNFLSIYYNFLSTY